MKIVEVLDLFEGPTNKIDSYIALKYPEIKIENLATKSEIIKNIYKKDPSLGKGWLIGALTEIDNLCSMAINHPSLWNSDSPEVEEAYNRYVELFNSNQDYLDNLDNHNLDK